uniref:Core domain-containing protein n=1 Tax=Attheya septentrionalis TaxID=420275 RepID=A0A7S2U9E6_9STRA|mmetsp:Transcript_15446/g.28043  ORF Transcript_15446/g.28043 Transcript_15446/m.28043 type:complete len:177 (+) Transcript_15446:88-618(+)
MAVRLIFLAIAVVVGACSVNGFGVGGVGRAWVQRTTTPTSMSMSESATTQSTDAGTAEGPEDPVICIKDQALERLRELKSKQKDPNEVMVLRMGVRNGGCSGLSYVMDFSTEAEIQEDDMVDEYTTDNIKCVVDAKSMLYLYGLELDYSDELIGGGFKFFNPNAEESCGCGSSFGV